jgi:hypothetical protein
LTGRLEKALAEALGTEAAGLDLVAAGRDAIEIHGWVTSRSARVRALAAARPLLGPGTRLVDRLLVWGEDDLPSPDPRPERESA